MTGATGDLLRQLRVLETELHGVETRRDRDRLEALLHPEFVELARSGRRYDRKEVLLEFSADSQLEPVHSRDYELVQITRGAALLTYRSAHVDADGNLFRHTLRSSLWIHTERGWQMRFHQGTTTDS